MKINYELAGMNYGACVSSGKSALLKLPEAQEAEVRLHPQSAVLTMRKAIDVKDLQAQLRNTGHCTIKEVATQLFET